MAIWLTVVSRDHSVPACTAPALMILFWADIKAKQLGTLSPSASDYTARVRVGKEEHKSWLRLVWDMLIVIDALGLVLLGTGFSLFLLPFTLYATAKDQWRNRECRQSSSGWRREDRVLNQSLCSLAYRHARCRRCHPDCVYPLGGALIVSLCADYHGFLMLPTSDSSTSPPTRSCRSASGTAPS